jgi:hypothetical protein
VGERNRTQVHQDRQSGPDGGRLTSKSTKIASSHSSRSDAETTTAYERIINKLHELDLRPRAGYRQTVARCPGHDDRHVSFAATTRAAKPRWFASPAVTTNSTSCRR